MRILDNNTDNAVRDITLYLKFEEAEQLYDSVGMLLKEKDFSIHVHINDASYNHEITIVLYDEGQMECLNERSKKIILENK